MAEVRAYLGPGVALGTIRFPPVCPKCLGTADLTTYTTKWRKEKIKIPICRTCRRTTTWKTRRQLAIVFAVWAPICWGTLVVLIVLDVLIDIIMRLGFPWGLFPVLMLIGTPLYALYQLLFPGKEIAWPVTVEEPGDVIAMENGAYAPFLSDANPGRFQRVVDSGSDHPQE